MRFLTPGGLPVPAVTAAEMRAVDRVAIEETGPNLYQMMENAGRALAEVALGMLSGRRSARVTVLAGTGGNGGGGICAARHLANRGVDVALMMTNPAGLGPVPAGQLRVFQSTPGTVVTAPPPADLVLDAVIGYSLTGPPSGAAAELIAWAGAGPVPVVALDVPSGLDATTGAAPGAVVRAAATVTLALPKTGLASPRGRAAAGRLFLADLGLPAAAFARAGVPLPRPVFDSAFVVPLEVVD